MANTQISTMLATTAVLALAACGGSSTSSSMNFVDIDNQNIAKTFADGSGILRVKATADGVTDTSSIFAPNYRTYNTNTGILPVDVDAAGVEVISFSDGFTQYGEYGQVNYRYNGSLNTMFIYVTDSEDAGVILVEGPLAHAASSFGPEIISLPNGSFTYRGDIFTKSRSETGIEEGTFFLIANFTTRTATIEAQTATTQLSGTNLLINSTGEISGANLTMSVPGQTSTSAGLEGNFHGQGARGVSGIYYNNSSNPTHIGAFAGTR